MTYVHSVGDLRTGRIVDSYPLSGTQWSRQLNDAGTWTGTLDLEDPEHRQLRPRFDAAPAKSFYLVEYDELSVAGGVVWTHAYTRKPKRSVQLGGAGLWSLWDHRKVVPALTHTQVPAAAADTNLTGWSLGTIAKRLVQQAQAHVGGDLPIVFPPDVAGSAQRSYEAFGLEWLGDVLRKLTQVIAGPDLDFVPRRVEGDASRVEFVFRIGDPWLEQAGDPWFWDDSVDQPVIVDLATRIDASTLGMRAWIPGEGMDREKKFGLAEDLELVDAGYPLLEVEDTSHATTQEQSTLDSHAAELVARRSRPLEQWTVSVRADADPVLGTYQPGDTAVIAIDDDPYIPTGDHLVRLTGMSGDDSDVVKLQIAPDTAIV